MSELKPCPFCGRSDVIFNQDTDIVHCRWCGGVYDSLFLCDASWNTRRIEDALNACIAELERRAARAKELLQDEMGDWLTVEAIYMPDHYLQLKQTIDVLDGGGE